GSVADDQPQTGVLEPLLAVGRSRENTPREVGCGLLPPTAERMVPSPRTPECSVIRAQLQKSPKDLVRSRERQGPPSGWRIPTAIMRQEVKLASEIGCRLVPARLRQSELAMLLPEARRRSGHLRDHAPEQAFIRDDGVEQVRLDAAQCTCLDVIV